MLDRLPAWARHIAIVFGAVFGGSVANAIVTGGGVTSLDWITTLRTAVDLGAVSTATAVLVLWLTPLTRQYGIGEGK